MNPTNLRERFSEIPRHQKVVGGVVLLIVIVLAGVYYQGKSTNRRAETAREAATSPPPVFGKSSPSEGGAIQMGAFSEELVHEHFHQKDDELMKRIREGEQRDTDQDMVQAEVLKRLQDIETKVDKGIESHGIELKQLSDLIESMASRVAAGAGRPQGPTIGPLKIIEQKKEKPRAEAGRRSTAASASPYYLPAGSLVRVRTLNGVSAYPATAGSGAAFPVALVIMDNWIGPNAYTIPMKGCTLLGQADGDLASERVKIVTHLFSCVFPKGRTLDRALNAWVTGPDGSLGIKGKVVDRRGRKLGLSFIAGFTAGLSQAFAIQEVTRVVSADGTERQIVTGDAITHASTSALSQAMADIAKFMKEEAARLMPTVDIPGGVDGTLITSEGIDIPEIVNLFGEEGIQ